MRLNLRRSMFMLAMLTVTVFLVAACGGSEPAAPAAAKKPAAETTGNPEYLALLEAAEKEGTLTVSGMNYEPEDVKNLESGFLAKFGFPVKIISDPGHVRELPARLKAGGKYDVIDGSGITAGQVEDIVGLQPVDWSIFPESEFPGLMQNYADRSRPGINCVLFFRFSWAFVYNTDMLSEDELPNSMEDLTDPKWKHRFAVSDLAVPLGTMSLQWDQEEGMEKMLDLARRLRANEPVIASGGSPGAIAKVIAGEVPIATAAFSSALGQMDKGAPIKLLPFRAPEAGSDKAYQPGLAMNVCPIKESANPNMAKLFTAWVSTGYPEAVAKNRGHFRPFRAGDTSVIAKFYQSYGIGIDNFLTHKNVAQEKQRKAVYGAAAKVYAGLAD
jgi:iron(III) transport system substrate-binding protein